MSPLFKSFIVLILTLLATVFTGAAFAATANLTWTHPTQRVDNTSLALSEIKETEIEYGTCTGTAEPFGISPIGSKVFPVGTTPTQSGQVTSLAYGKWCFRARTVPVVQPDTNKSDWTGTVWAQYLAPPKPPTWGTVNIVAYEIRWNPGRGTVLGKAVGTVPLGTACGNQRITSQGVREYHEIPLDSVELVDMPQSAIVVAECEVAS